MHTSKTFILFSLIIILLVGCKKEEISTPIVNYKSTPLSNSDEEPDTKEYLIAKVTGIKNIKGLMNFALYNSNSSFNKPDQAFREYFIEVDGMPTMEFRFDDIPPGEYALALFHDENSNYELDQNFFGIPKEGFGFSNNAMGNFGPPSYQDAKFELKEGSYVTLNIELVFY
jgi:uncharacterized protein (DUF2141 family)